MGGMEVKKNKRVLFHSIRGQWTLILLFLRLVNKLSIYLTFNYQHINKLLILIIRDMEDIFNYVF